ncbi:MAG TPA: hypothetical protein VJ965_06750 [Anaerolineales bacterium]|nr:hypothetical protein [Anaerolineales bacterium]
MSESTKHKNNPHEKKQGLSSHFIEKVATELQSVHNNKREK